MYDSFFSFRCFVTTLKIWMMKYIFFIWFLYVVLAETIIFNTCNWGKTRGRTHTLSPFSFTSEGSDLGGFTTPVQRVYRVVWIHTSLLRNWNTDHYCYCLKCCYVMGGYRASDRSDKGYIIVISHFMRIIIWLAMWISIYFAGQADHYDLAGVSQLL